MNDEKKGCNCGCEDEVKTCKCGCEDKEEVCKCDSVIDEVCEDEDEGEEIITLFNEETKEEEEFRIVEIIDYEEKDYVFLNPVEPDDEIGEDEVIICQIGEDENGEGFILPVESEEVMNKVYEKYVALYESQIEEAKK